MPGYDEDNYKVSKPKNSSGVLTGEKVILFIIFALIPIATFGHIFNLFQSKSYKKAIAWLIYMIVFWSTVILAVLSI